VNYSFKEYVPHIYNSDASILTAGNVWLKAREKKKPDQDLLKMIA